jgi:hypothetical protein
MPNLTHSLQGRDLGFLKIIAELWEVDFDAQDARSGIPLLAGAMLDRQRLGEVVAKLPPDAQDALGRLVEAGGRLPWALFARKYGAIREVGAGRRDREQVYRSPISTSEVLWYRGLLARNFFDGSKGPEEYAYLPDDLAELLPEFPPDPDAPFGRPASPLERAQPIPVTSAILDQACTRLAALRVGLCEAEAEASGAAAIPAWVDALLQAAGLLDANGLPLPEPTRLFLEAERGQALLSLFQAWRDSEIFDELRLHPDLICEGEWKNDPLRTRQAVLGFLGSVPKGTWWSIEEFVNAVQKRLPDFQRPAGDYDSWFIRQRGTGEYLRGFEHWQEVEGALLRWMMTGPMHALGLLDLASAQPGEAPTAFRTSAWWEALLEGNSPTLPREQATIKLRSDGRLGIPPGVPRSARYQITRFCTWEAPDRGEFRGRITPASLERARKQGLSVSHLLALLRKYAQAVPPSLARALERWNEKGAEARLEKVSVLRVAAPEIMQSLRATPAARFLGDLLGPTSIIVKTGAEEKVLSALAEMGFLGEIVSS